jgi:hypothetical protein
VLSGIRTTTKDWLKMKCIIALISTIFGASVAYAQTTLLTPDYVKARQEAACSVARRGEVSVRLEAIRAIDQGGRQPGAATPYTPQSDLDNRKEVATLFAEGCFTTGRDYHNAAVVYQHGEVPEHYYQTFVWASRAVQLGDAEARWLIPRAIDRWALNSGYKQLFATNLVTESYFGRVTELSQKTWCVWPNVSGITDRQRRALGVGTMAQQVTRAKGMNTGESSSICTIQVPDPPLGMFPGYW